MVDQTNPDTPRDHDDSIPYSKVIVPGAELDPTDWEAWDEPDEDGTHYYVKGPCPGCYAPAQGHVLDKATGPTQAMGRSGAKADDETAKSPAIEIPVSCACGSGHGNKDATGCGRSWILELEEDA